MKQLSVAVGVWICMCAFAGAGCTATVDADKSKLGPRPVGCSVGAHIMCACLGGLVSTQTCNAYGRYDPCQCVVGDFGNAGSGG